MVRLCTNSKVVDVKAEPEVKADPKPDAHKTKLSVMKRTVAMSLSLIHI